ncbi:MAG: hypothetical protein IH600_10585 [Bacteroidetes bacterium]|nr:hypothetical protein [Bacteroidota bacterium]
MSPYGQWVDYPEYGYVWLPDAGPDFAPYSTQGHWIYTDYGWTWVSDYRWGWAPFHYGRWDYDDYYGWFWVPDNEWGPSWVTWRRSQGYYGWEPMGPGISISLSFGGQSHHRGHDHWTFVRDRDIERHDLHRYRIDRNDRDREYRTSTVINHTYIDKSRNSTYITGPQREDVQRATGHTIKPYAVHNNSAPGEKVEKGQLQIYRPQIEREDRNGHRAAPSKLTQLKDIRPPSERTESPTQKRDAVTPRDPQVNSRPAQQQSAKPAQQQSAKPAQRTEKPEQQQTAKPAQRTVKPAQQQSAKPAQRTAKPAQRTAKPAQRTAKPAQRTAKPAQQQTAKPAKSTPREQKSAAPSRPNKNDKQTKTNGNPNSRK